MICTIWLWTYSTHSHTRKHIILDSQTYENFTSLYLWSHYLLCFTNTTTYRHTQATICIAVLCSMRYISLSMCCVSVKCITVCCTLVMCCVQSYAFCFSCLVLHSPLLHLLLVIHVVFCIVHITQLHCCNRLCIVCACLRVFWIASDVNPNTNTWFVFHFTFANIFIIAFTRTSAQCITTLHLLCDVIVQCIIMTIYNNI